MKSYVVEFENLVTNDPIIIVFSGESEDSVWKDCMEYANTHDYTSRNFDMYPLYRKPDGSLEMGGVIF